MDGELRTLHGVCIRLRGLTAPAINAGMTTFGHVKHEILQSRIRRGGLHLRLQIILQTDLFNQLQLCFQPVNVFFLAFEDGFK